MLRWIRISNVAVIDAIEVEFEPGLNLITGETGAGKSILIDALGLLLGDRASSELIRTGAASAVVEAGFELEDPPSSLATRLEEASVPFEGEIVIRREVAKGGRGKVVVNGVAGSRALLRDIGETLADVHGQGENLSLLRPEAAIDLLDDYGGSGALRSRITSAFERLSERDEALRRATKALVERDSRKELAEFVLRELDAADLNEGEDDELARERELVAHAEKLKTVAERAYTALYDDEHAVLSRLAGVYKQLEELAAIDPRWESYLEERASVTGPLDDLALSLRDYGDEIEVTPGRLDEIETRRAQLERLKKKYGGTLEAVIARREECRVELAELEDGGDRLKTLEAELERERAKYRSLAEELSRMRANAAKKLQRAVEKELPSLALEKARFAVALSDAPWTESGKDAAELMFSANPGEDPKPLAKVASGGELSRFMLALKSVAARDEAAKLLVFDEVDTGIGGRVADAVGEKLAELARAHQVICVTHLPQIARFAPAHFRIVKVERAGRITTGISRLSSDERVEEIARMLAGATITESALEHARQLISGNAESRTSP